MANDRLWLACRFCDQGIVLWKHYPVSGGYRPVDAEHVDAFIQAHLEEHDNRAFASRLGDPPPFEILTEGSVRSVSSWKKESA